MKIILFGELFPREAFTLVNDSFQAKNSIIKISSFHIEAEKEVDRAEVSIEQEKVRQDIHDFVVQLNFNPKAQLHDFLYLGRRDIPGGEQNIAGGLSLFGKFSFNGIHYGEKIKLISITNNYLSIELSFFNSAVFESDIQDKLLKFRKAIEAIKNNFGTWKVVSEELLSQEEGADAKILAEIRNSDYYGVGHAPKIAVNEVIPNPKYHSSWEELTRNVINKFIAYLDKH